VGDLFEDLMPRLAAGNEDEDPHIIALYEEITGRMRGAARTELQIADSGLQASYEAIQRLNIASPTEETRLRIRAMRDLGQLRHELRALMQSMDTFMLSNASDDRAAFARNASPTLFRDVYQQRYRAYVITKAAQQIVDQKATIGQFGLGQQKIVEEAAKEVAALSKRLARMVFVKGMKVWSQGKACGNVTEETWGLVFDVSWGALEALSKQVCDSWIDGQEFDEEAFFEQMRITVALAYQKYLLDWLKRSVGERTGGFRKVFIELGIDIGGDLMQQLEQAMAGGADAGQAFQQVFTGDKMVSFLYDFGTDKLWEAMIGAGAKAL